ncbi:hypothetical protein BKA83DRAFT_4129947, partial [Pisolithus microcarpus]
MIFGIILKSLGMLVLLWVLQLAWNYMPVILVDTMHLVLNYPMWALHPCNAQHQHGSHADLPWMCLAATHAVAVVPKVILSKEAWVILTLKQKSKSEHFRQDPENAWSNITEVTVKIAATHHKSLKGLVKAMQLVRLEMILFAVCGSTDLPLNGIAFTMEGVNDFMDTVMGIDNQGLIRKMEGFTVQGVKEEMTREPNMRMQWVHYFQNVVTWYLVVIKAMFPMYSTNLRGSFANGNWALFIDKGKKHKRPVHPEQQGKNPSYKSRETINDSDDEQENLQIQASDNPTAPIASGSTSVNIETLAMVGAQNHESESKGDDADLSASKSNRDGADQWWEHQQQEDVMWKRKSRSPFLSAQGPSKTQMKARMHLLVSEGVAVVEDEGRNSNGG